MRHPGATSTHVTCKDLLGLQKHSAMAVFDIDSCKTHHTLKNNMIDETGSVRYDILSVVYLCQADQSRVGETYVLSFQ